MDRTLQAISVACLLIGLIPLGVCLISAFGALHLDLSYGTVGLYVGKLDEQHPWLYDARSLTKHGIAEEYRQRTLQERGFLRGADYVLMRELVQAQEALARVRAARSVAEQFQSLPVAAQGSFTSRAWCVSAQRETSVSRSTQRCHGHRQRDRGSDWGIDTQAHVVVAGGRGATRRWVHELRVWAARRVAQKLA